RQAEVRDAAAEVVERWRQGTLTLPPPPSDEQLVEMLSICMGEPVPAEYGRMLAEEARIPPGDYWTTGR
ncbi:MAG: monooxygenase, partial [Modestobacter sp.]|nr:monooxygenase [Modestobacter sp.]